MNQRVRAWYSKSPGSSHLLWLVFLLLWGPACWSGETRHVSDISAGNDFSAGMLVPDDGKMTQEPSVQELGGEKFRVGAITVDRSKRLISVPGRMLSYEEGKPIEFVATMKQGFKSYESILMLEVSAFEFNLACILIGLDADRAIAPSYHFDPEPVKGDEVSISVGWRENGRWIEKDAVDLIKVGDGKPASPAVWVYTGSAFIEGDRYLAQIDGVLIGLIHSPASIIEHREGIGLGNYGIIAIDSANAPVGGQEIVLQVQGLD